MYSLYQRSENDRREKGDIEETGDEKRSAADVVDVYADSAAAAKARGIDTEHVTKQHQRGTNGHSGDRDRRPHHSHWEERNQSCQSECDKKEEGRIDTGKGQAKGFPPHVQCQQRGNNHRGNSHNRTSREARHGKLGSENKARDPSVVRTLSDEKLIVDYQEQPDVRMSPFLHEGEERPVHSTTPHRNTIRFENNPVPGAVAVSGPDDIVTSGSICIGYGEGDIIIDTESPVDVIPEAYLVTNDDEKQAQKRRRCVMGLVALTLIVVAVIVALAKKLPPPSDNSTNQWVDPIQSVVGEFKYAHSGKSTAISADGTVLAIGEPGVDTVRVFDKNESSWVLRGDPLRGPIGSSFGYSVDISEDGSTVAAGGPTCGTFEGTGIVQIYRWTLPHRAWRKLHEVNGTVDSKDGICLGTDVTLSSSGRTLALLAPYAAPLIEIWTSSTDDLDSTDPSQYFSQLSKNEYAGEVAPRTISLSGDGLMIAVQLVAAATGASSHVNLHKINWRLQGSPIIGNITVVSKNVAMMAVAVATSLRDGSKLIDEFVDDDSLVDNHVFETTIYKWHESSSNWMKWGDVIEGFPVSSYFDGSIVAVAVPSLIQIYQNIAGSWTELGEGIPVQSALSKVSVSPSIVNGFDGLALAVSEWDWEGTEGPEQGRTTVHGLAKSPSTTMPMPPPTPEATPGDSTPPPSESPSTTMPTLPPTLEATPGDSTPSPSELPSTTMPTPETTPGATPGNSTPPPTEPPPTYSHVFTLYAFQWYGNSEASCRATEPAPTVRCGGNGAIVFKEYNSSNHNCQIDVTSSNLAVCTAQPEGLANVSCYGEAAVDRELSVTLPAINIVCNGDFAADENPGMAYQYLLLSTFCGDKWVFNVDTCSAESGTLDTGERFCASQDDCGDATCTASIAAVTVTSTGQNQEQCTYSERGEPTYPPTSPPTSPTYPPTPTDSPPTDLPTDPPTDPPETQIPTLPPPLPPLPTPPCETGLIELKLEVTTDLYPEDLTWTIQKQGDETNILEGGPYTDALTKFSYEACIPSEECYQFRFSDQNQDGPCCLNGEGGFTLVWDEEVTATYQHSDSANGVSTEWFGECSF